MATPVPVAGGFAAALETFLSRGGSRVSKPTGRPGMRFSEGPIRGKTVEQATEMARGMWAKASPAVREKYAGREAAAMAPSERQAYRRQIAGIEPAMPGQSKFSQGTRRATPGDLDGDGMQDAAQPSSAVPREAAKTINPAATTGAGRGTAVKDGAPDWENMGVASRTPQVHPTRLPGQWKAPQATPEEQRMAEEIARDAANHYGESSSVVNATGAVSTDRPTNPCVVAPHSALSKPSRAMGDAVRGALKHSESVAAGIEAATSPTTIAGKILHENVVKPITGVPGSIRRTLTKPFDATAAVIDAVMAPVDPTRMRTGVTEAPKAWVGRPEERPPEMAAALEFPATWSGEEFPGVQEQGGRINKLTGKPIGYVPPAQTIPGIERPGGNIPRTPPAQTIPGIERPSAGMSFDPRFGAVPKATEVPEAPMTAAEYGKVKASQDVNDVNALDPTSPEASAARGRMRTYEDQQRAAAAAVARRERVGPSPAERDAQQRKAARALDRRVMAGYGRVL